MCCTISPSDPCCEASSTTREKIALTSICVFLFREAALDADRLTIVGDVGGRRALGSGSVERRRRQASRSERHSSGAVFRVVNRRRTWSTWSAVHAIFSLLDQQEIQRDAGVEKHGKETRRGARENLGKAQVVCTRKEKAKLVKRKRKTAR